MSNLFKWVSRSLGLQFVAVAVAALACAFVSHHLVSDVAARWFFFDPRFDAYWEERSMTALEEFQDYVSQQGLSVRQALTDTWWSLTHPEITLFTEPYIPYDQEEGGHYHAIRCSDGDIYAISYSPGGLYLAQWDAAGLAAGSACFLAVFLPFTVHIIRRIKRLYQQLLLSVRSGHDKPIQVRGSDEIAELGREIELMRQSMLGLLENEAHLRHNGEHLVASLSHDIRTPLTKLMGYLDILLYKKASPAQWEGCLEKASEKARQLKGLTDELFCRFSAGGEAAGQARSLVDGPQLLNQLLYEACCELEEDGFQVEGPPTFSGEYYFNVRVEELRRAFDNIFSNLRKYAEPGAPIQIRALEAAGQVSLTIANRKRRSPEDVPSYGIGLPTVKELMERNGGRAEVEDGADAFSIRLTLPPVAKPRRTS